MPISTGSRPRRKDPSAQPSRLHWRRLIGVAAIAVTALLRTAVAQVATTDQIVVQADRFPNANSNAAFDVTAVDAEELQRAPQLRLDDILRAQVPGFSLFRRNGSRTANPTTHRLRKV